MDDLTANTFHRLSKDDQDAIKHWLFAHGINSLFCSHITLDEGRFDAHMYGWDYCYKDGSGPGLQLIVDSVGNPVITVKRINTHQPLDGNIVRRWLQLECEEARRG